tara:strand:- start:24975 stop:25775 length:801 start_codon:yes stop_codon:yes gene_type:complete
MNNVKFDFKGKTILITAGTKGIGFELTKSFLDCGANVATFSRNRKNHEILKKKLKNYIFEKKLFIFKHDLNQTNKEKLIVNKVNKYFHKNIDILVNNSGGPPPRLFLETSNKDWSRALNINFLSALKFSKSVIPGMKSKKWGRIINLTSVTAKEPSKNMVLSNVTRAALASFSKTLSIEVAQFGITVNTILTGGCLTDRLISLIEGQSSKTNIKSEINKLSKLVPVGYIANTDEFIQTILFLASNNSSYLNGISIPIDGGASKSLF